MSIDALSQGVGAQSRIGAAAHAELFWYTKRSALALTMLLFVVVQVIAWLTPPFQASDEPAHIKRAYLLSRGEIFLSSEDGATGGNIDAGLLQYIAQFDHLRFQYARKHTASLDDASRSIEWAGQSQFSRLPNTAFYFPMAYLPQAVALATGESAGLSVRDSYYLARLFSCVATLALILAALLVYPVPPMVLAILFMPMTLFQVASASLDAVSFGAATLAGALFMRGADDRLSFDTALFVALIVCLFLLASSRIALLPLAPLPLLLRRVRERRWYVVTSVLMVAATLAWIVGALGAVEGVPARELSTAEIIKYYLLNPAALAGVFIETITDVQVLDGYWRMFVGVLGWLDVPLGSEVYVGEGILFVALIVAGLYARGREPGPLLNAGGAWLAGGAVGSVLLMFFALLVTYNPHPAVTIGGVLGRYFIPMLIVLAYAIFSKLPAPGAFKIESMLVFAMLALSAVGTIPRLLHRYWVA